MRRDARNSRGELPRAGGEDRATLYREHAPAPDLAPLVACTWERTVSSNGVVETRVLPDGCVDLVLTNDGQLFVAGPDTAPVVYALRSDFGAVGLRLRPGVAASVLGLSLAEIRDLRVPIEELWGRAAADLGERLATAQDPRRRRRGLEEAVRPRALEADPDPLVRASVPLLGKPGARVTLACRVLAISERQLRRRFEDSVGYGPKTLDRVLRFRRFLGRARTILAGEETLAGSAIELGYTDQAHLSRECQRLSGLSPRQLVAHWAG